MALDLRENENCKKTIDKHMKVFGKLSVLANNSMTSPISTFDVVEKTCRTNVLSIFIANSSSVAGNPQLVDYWDSPTNGVIATFTQSLAQQQAPKGIKVNACRTWDYVS